MDGDFIACLWDKGPALLNQRVGRIVAGPTLNQRFLYYCLQPALQRLQNSTSATTVKHLSHDDIKQLICAFPRRIEEQNEIANVLLNLDENLQHQRQKIEMVCQLKHAVMEPLLTGNKRI